MTTTLPTTIADLATLDGIGDVCVWVYESGIADGLPPDLAVLQAFLLYGALATHPKQIAPLRAICFPIEWDDIGA